MLDSIDQSGLSQVIKDEVAVEYEQSGFQKNKTSWKAYSTAIGGFIYMIFPGSVYCTGVF